MTGNKPTIMEKINNAKVEWKTLGEVAKISSGGTPRTEVAEYYNGDIPWLRTQEVNFSDIWDTGVKITEAGLKNSSAKWIPENCVILAMYGATVGRVGINKIPITTNQACANIQVDSSVLNYRYVFYYLSSQYEYIKSLGTGSQTNINAQIVKNLKIPIPSLDLQQDIATILDKFTALKTELCSALQTELSLRKKQYHYYREKLLTFGDEVEWKTVEEIFTLKNGYTPSKANPEYWENGDIPWFRMEDLNTNGNVLNQAIQQVNRKGIKGKLFPAHSIIMATSATIGEHALITIDFMCNQRFTNFSIKEQFKPLLLPKFIYYYFFILDEKAKKTVNMSSFPSVKMDELRKWLFPIPPISEQQRIANILDKFDTLTNSISEGLPREIELRKKQYEYYREKLLTFPDSGNRG